MDGLETPGGADAPLFLCLCQMKICTATGSQVATRVQSGDKRDGGAATPASAPGFGQLSYQPWPQLPGL
jgi:hypothetical protein